MKTLLLIDGNSVLNRAFYGIRPLTNSKGLFTHAVYGMMNVVLRHLEALKPDGAAVAFDRREPTFRHLRYEGYKATRKGMPEELAVQLPYAKESMIALGLKKLELAGYEADDILGTCAAFAEKDPELNVYLLTGDRDSFQLINDRVKVLYFTKGETVTIGREEFVEKYGVQPEQFVDVKALMGDSSDNIPGVPGIGEKTALKLIADYKSLEGVYKEGIPGGKLTAGTVKKLENGRESAELSKELAQICKEAPLGITPEELAYNGPDREALRPLLAELELTSLARRLGVATIPTDSSSQTSRLGVVSSSTETPSQTSRLGITAAEKSASGAGKSAPGAENSTSGAAEPPCTPDKSRSTDPLYTRAGLRASPALTEPKNRQTLTPDELKEKAKKGLKNAAFTFREGKATLFDGENEFNIPFEDPKELEPLFADKERTLTVADAKKLALTFGRTECKIFDVTLAAYVLNPEENSEDLARLAVKALGVIPPEGSDPATLLYALEPALKRKLAEGGQSRLYEEIEEPLAAVLADMEKTGFKIDRAGLEGYRKELAELIEGYREQIFFCAGHEFNVNSPKQLGEVLFEELKLPHSKKTKTGYSTGAEILEKLRPYHPIIDLILEYRQAAKLLSTYAEGLLKVADEEGRVHSSFNQTVTATGRLSSSEPNLQNIPIRSEMGKRFRKYFIPKNEEYVLVDADYSQVELRLLAAISGDETMVKAFLEGEDIHTRTAAQVFGVPIEAVTPELRKRAKAVNFGIIYGIGPFSLAADLGVTTAEADRYIKNYLARYPGVCAYLEETVASAKRDGFVTTIFGRKRYIPELASPKKQMQAFGKRVAMNSPIQGAAADIIKIAMVRTDKALRESGIDAKLILQVHDELILEAHRSCAKKAADLLKREMEAAVPLVVPLIADVGIGDTWLDC